MGSKPRRLPPMEDRYDQFVEVILSPSLSDIDNGLEQVKSQCSSGKIDLSEIDISRGRSKSQTVLGKLKSWSSRILKEDEQSQAQLDTSGLRKPFELVPTVSGMTQEDIQYGQRSKTLVSTNLFVNDAQVRAMKLRREKIVTDFISRECIRKPSVIERLKEEDNESIISVDPLKDSLKSDEQKKDREKILIDGVDNRENVISGGIIEKRRGKIAKEVSKKDNKKLRSGVAIKEKQDGTITKEETSKDESSDILMAEATLTKTRDEGIKMAEIPDGKGTEMLMSEKTSKEKLETLDKSDTSTLIASDDRSTTLETLSIPGSASSLSKGKKEGKSSIDIHFETKASAFVGSEKGGASRKLGHVKMIDTVALNEVEIAQQVLKTMWNRDFAKERLYTEVESPDAHIWAENDKEHTSTHKDDIKSLGHIHDINRRTSIKDKLNRWYKASHSKTTVISDSTNESVPEAKRESIGNRMSVMYDFSKKDNFRESKKVSRKHSVKEEQIRPKKRSLSRATLHKEKHRSMRSSLTNDALAEERIAKMRDHARSDSIRDKTSKTQRRNLRSNNFKEKKAKEKEKRGSKIYNLKQSSVFDETDLSRTPSSMHDHLNGEIVLSPRTASLIDGRAEPITDNCIRDSLNEERTETVIDNIRRDSSNEERLQPERDSLIREKLKEESTEIERDNLGRVKTGEEKAESEKDTLRDDRSKEERAERKTYVLRLDNMTEEGRVEKNEDTLKRENLKKGRAKKEKDKLEPYRLKKERAERDHSGHDIVDEERDVIEDDSLSSDGSDGEIAQTSSDSLTNVGLKGEIDIAKNEEKEITEKDLKLDGLQGERAKIMKQRLTKEGFKGERVLTKKGSFKSEGFKGERVETRKEHFKSDFKEETSGKKSYALGSDRLKEERADTKGESLRTGRLKEESDRAKWEKSGNLTKEKKLSVRDQLKRGSLKEKATSKRADLEMSVLKEEGYETKKINLNNYFVKDKTMKSPGQRGASFSIDDYTKSKRESKEDARSRKHSLLSDTSGARSLAGTARERKTHFERDRFNLDDSGAQIYRSSLGSLESDSWADSMTSIPEKLEQEYKSTESLDLTDSSSKKEFITEHDRKSRKGILSAELSKQFVDAKSDYAIRQRLKRQEDLSIGRIVRGNELLVLSTESSTTSETESAPSENLVLEKAEVGDPKILAKNYIQAKGICELFQLLTTKLVLERPSKPLDFLIETVRDILAKKSAIHKNVK